MKPQTITIGYDEYILLKRCTHRYMCIEYKHRNRMPIEREWLNALMDVRGEHYETADNND